MELMLEMEQRLIWLLKTAISRAETAGSFVTDALSSIDIQMWKAKGLNAYEQVETLVAISLHSAQNELKILFNDVSEVAMELSWREMAIAAFFTAFFLWTMWLICQCSASTQAKGGAESFSEYSIFDLAKTAYMERNASEVVRLVDVFNFDCNYHIPSNGMTLFLCACIGGSAQLAHHLLKKGADYHVRNYHGDTCLHLAVFATSGSKYPNKDLVNLLLEKGANVNARNNSGTTPLHIAAMEGDSDMIQLLLRYGADSASCTPDGILPMYIALNSGYTAAARLLMVDVRQESSSITGSSATPPMVKLGLLSPEKAHLAMSSLPRMSPDFR
ncbi:uncharacterized protein [Diadema antillarum]|uniref:uncharacterized protein n=1 Tax=Diadema antillarum TaxID=105358 RepID=UPI003A876D24